MRNQTITGVDGLLAGHATDMENNTGCTAVLCPEGFTPGVHVPGFSPGTREIDLLRPESRVEEIHGLVLAGGSAFGLASADGVVRFLRERGKGLVTTYARIPLVAGAIIYDLDANRKPGLLPDAAMGYAAAAAASDAPLEQGSVGAGRGAHCGRLYGFLPEMPEGGKFSPMSKAGLGSWLLEHRGLKVGALAVVNALGDIHDPANGAWLAGGRDAQGRPLDRETRLAALAAEAMPRENTVLVAVAVNAPLNKLQTTRLARMASAGIARVIRPAHLTYDGDVVFALAAREPLPPSVASWTENLLGDLAAEAVAQALVNAVRFA